MNDVDMIPPGDHLNHRRPSTSTANTATQQPPTRGTDTGRYASMTDAGVALQQEASSRRQAVPGAHPSSRAATGGQSHSHRPVSAMPTPTVHSNDAQPSRTSTSSRPNDAAHYANAAGMNPSYSERRASAHPTMGTGNTNTSQGGAGGGPNPALAPHVDPATRHNALSSGIPLTSPAAISYFAAHPRRQQVHFGNYLLLQTLGEGEFGKVKLGVHKEWGEEVAVKLIKREKVGSAEQLQLNGPPKDPAKMSKVEREIQVLKDVRHPNIVRLYEVIESDKYIGIVLEYASGGELFDHILAHKYLKERDACRLFAQLISGVSYLHQKKVVHRDLKLENLLLDRNRNVIITDFGFANNFEHRRDDLMATSCGSPCYAAPELVVQDGLYAGSAVDVWSCGVILYAMLAGYLPFDDDPANPDGDNINLLYKYIMATPLSFPDYITPQPRDLLSRMLVPDPLRRADLDAVMAHSWLAPYRDLFQFSVDELERAAIEQQTKKRQVYRQQMHIQQQMQDQQRHQQQVPHSQSASRGGGGAHASNGGGGLAPQSNKSQRHHSAMATPTTAGHRQSRAQPDQQMYDPQDVEVLHSPADVADEEVRKPSAQKTQRHTIQLEYDGDERESPRAPQQQRRGSGAGAGGTSPISANGHSSDVPPVPKVSRNSSTSRRATAEPFTPAVPVVVPAAERQTNRRASARAEQQGLDGISGMPAPIMEHRPPTIAVGDAMETLDHRQPSDGQANNGARGVSNPNVPQDSTSFPPSTNGNGRAVSASGLPGSTATKNARPVSAQFQPTSNGNGNATPNGTTTDRQSARHRKGMSTDKFFLTRLLSGSDKHNTENGVDGGAQQDGAPLPRGSDSTATRTPSTNKGSSGRRKAVSLVVGGRSTSNGFDGSASAAARDRDKANSQVAAANKATKEERRWTGKMRKGDESNGVLVDGPTTPKQNNVGLPPASPSSSGRVKRQGSGTTSSRPPVSGSMRHPGLFEDSTNDSSNTVGPSSKAAKKVMDWFRKKSLSRSSGSGAFAEQPPLGPFDPHASVRTEKARSQQPKTGSLAVPNATWGQEAGRGVESSRSASATPETKTSSNGSSQQAITPRPSTTSTSVVGTPVLASRGTEALADSLRYHLGAVDQSALTSRPPLEVFAEVRNALFEMGIDARLEKDEDFKLECLRRKRVKGLMGATTGLGLSIRTSVFPPTQADYERSARSPTTSLGSAGMGTVGGAGGGSIRNFLRRGGNNVPPTTPSSSSPSAQDDPLATPGGSTLNGPSSATLPTPIYGEPSVDGGQEVRFSVEVTRIKNLPGLYSLDIRRLKGNLWAYKFLYHALLERCELAPAAPGRVAA